jgi:hypothetical protein
MLIVRGVKSTQKDPSAMKSARIIARAHGSEDLFVIEEHRVRKTVFQEL